MKTNKYQQFSDLFYLYGVDTCQNEIDELNKTKQNLLPTDMLLVRTTPTKMKNCPFKPSIWLNGVMPGDISWRINDLNSFIKNYKKLKHAFESNNHLDDFYGILQNVSQITLFSLMIPQDETGYDWIASNHLWGTGDKYTGSDSKHPVNIELSNLKLKYVCYGTDNEPLRLALKLKDLDNIKDVQFSDFSLPKPWSYTIRGYTFYLHSPKLDKILKKQQEAA